MTLTHQVLVVDDDKDIVELLATSLKARYQVVTAMSGAEALSSLKSSTFDAVVADQMMPGMTGVELLKTVMEQWPGAARILVTASERVDDLKNAVNVARVHRFISKPLRMGDLLQSVAGAVEQASLEEENRRLVKELSAKNKLLQMALSKVQDHERMLEHEVATRTSELKAAVAELEQLALRDGLTGLYNHRFFQEALTTELARAARHNHCVGLLFIDVDHFKNYNDLVGHQGGDEVLRQFARLLTGSRDAPEVLFRGRLSDIAARYGGEEFVIILPETSKQGSMLRGLRVLQSINAHPFPRGEVQPAGRVTASIGVAVFPDDAMNKQALIEAADQAVLLAKRSGRNQVRAANVEGEVVQGAIKEG